VEALVPMTMFVCIAAVLVLRPLTRKLGLLIEAATRERMQARSDDASDAQLVLIMEQMARRLDLIEQRLDFTERLVAAREPAAAAVAPGPLPRRTDVRAEPRLEERIDLVLRAGQEARRAAR
jgi:hypothetical protein